MLDQKIRIVGVANKNEKSLPFIKALPTWFNLQNYVEANQLDLEGWATQIYLRQVVADFYLPWSYSGIIQEYRIPAMHSSPANPSVAALSVHDALVVTEALKSCLSAPEEIWKSSSCFDALSNLKPTKCIENEPSLLTWFNHQPELKQKYSNASLYEATSYAIVQSFVKVDLSAPDGILIDAFKKWLKQKRAASRLHGRGFSKAILRRWAVNQVLPYLDVTHWAKLSQVQIPHWLLGEALFPGNNAGDKVDRIRKTTERTAQEIMTGLCLRKMVAQLAHETGQLLDIENVLNDAHALNQIKKGSKCPYL